MNKETYTRDELLNIFYIISKRLQGESILLDLNNVTDLLSKEITLHGIINGMHTQSFAQGKVSGKLELMYELMQEFEFLKKD